MASKPWQGLFENNRRIRSKLPSANLQVTCAPASCSLAPQNPSQLHNNRSLINKHCWPLRFDMTGNYQVKNATWIQYSSLATASAQQCNTCYRRDGTIASRSINRENNIEALAIFKKIQIALGSPNTYEFYGGAKKKWAAVEKVNKNMCHISSFKSENQEVFWTFHFAVMQINGKEMYKKVCWSLTYCCFSQFWSRASNDCFL